MRYSISNAIPHNPKSEKHPYENLVNSGLFCFSEEPAEAKAHAHDEEQHSLCRCGHPETSARGGIPPADVAARTAAHTGFTADALAAA